MKLNVLGVPPEPPHGAVEQLACDQPAATLTPEMLNVPRTALGLTWGELP